MAHMSSNVEIPRRYFGDSSKLINWILESGATCHTTLEISDFIPVLLVETDKYFQVSNENFVTVKQTGEAQIKICDDNGKPFIDAL